MKAKKMKAHIQWIDSGMESGWRDLSGGFKGSEIIVDSYGVVIYEDEKIVCLAHNYADETDNSSVQANGIMTIPKCSILKVDPISFD